MGDGSLSKICSRERLMSLRDAARAEGRRVVHCHGCFDIVHPGHVRHLRQAKQLGDVLLVSITGDSGVDKGTGRPLIPEELRAENLAALDFVDWVFVESDATAVGLLDSVRPDVFVKGQEYEANRHAGFAAEKAAVERHGGRVVFTSGDVVFSSTALIAGIESSVNPVDKRVSELLAKGELGVDRLCARLRDAQGARAVVIGEVIEDEYVFCDRPAVATESPVLSLRPVQERSYLGGAAIVARHLAALGADATLLTALPRNEAVRESVRARLEGEGVSLVVVDQETDLAQKQRFLVGHEKVFKVDRVHKAVLDAGERDRLIGLAGEIAGVSDAAVVTDFGLGLFSAPVLDRLCREVRPVVRTMSADVSGSRNHLRAMRGLDLVCPSEQELRSSTRRFDESLPSAAWEHLHETGNRAAVVTMGAEGLVTFERNDDTTEEGDEGWGARLRSEHVPALSAMVVDALGCGDALLAAATLIRAVGGTVLESAFIGAVAASIHGSRVGNVPVDQASLRKRIQGLGGSSLRFSTAEALMATRTPVAG